MKLEKYRKSEYAVQRNRASRRKEGLGQEAQLLANVLKVHNGKRWTGGSRVALHAGTPSER